MKDLTQGCQVTLHSFHMFRQVFGKTILAMFIVGILTFSVKTWYDYTPYERWAAMAYYWANFKISLPLMREEDTREMTQFYTFKDGHTGIDIINDPWHQQLIQDINKQLIKNAWLALWSMMAFFLMVCAGLMWRGKVNRTKEILSGTEIVKPETLQKLLKSQKIVSSFHLGNVSMRLNSETQHLMFCGTTGTGKSNCFMQLFPQVRENKQRAIVIDTTGEFARRFYRIDTDILINPFDDRSVVWNPWVECQSPYHYDEIAQGFIPQTGNDQFWAEAARTVFAESLIYLKKKRMTTVEDLLNLLLNSSLSDLYQNLQNTPAASLLDPSGKKTAISIRSYLTPYLTVFRYLPKNKAAFSVRRWVRDGIENTKDDSWLFITSAPDQRETLRPLITGLMSIGMNSLMSTYPDSNRRIWFMIDELISLNKQESIPKALAGIRKYGGCIVASIQNISQLQAIYGLAETQSLTSLFNTKLIFRNSDPETAHYMAQMLGEQEIVETVERISFGTHQMQNGVSLNAHKHRKLVVSATDIMNLNDLEAYLKPPGDLPITHLKFQVNS